MGEEQNKGLVQMSNWCGSYHIIVIQPNEMWIFNYYCIRKSSQRQQQNENGLEKEKKKIKTFVAAIIMKIKIKKRWGECCKVALVSVMFPGFANNNDVAAVQL